MMLGGEAKKVFNSPVEGGSSLAVAVHTSPVVDNLEEEHLRNSLAVHLEAVVRRAGCIAEVGLLHRSSRT